MQAKILKIEIGFALSSMSERRQAKIVIEIGILDSLSSNNNVRNS